MRHIIHITTPPTRSGRTSVPDGAICGNGDLAVILGSAPDGLRLYLSKCDIWQGIEQEDAGGIKPLGYIDIPIPAALYARYSVEQDLDDGELRCRFVSGADKAACTIRVHKTENSICIFDTGNIPLRPSLHLPDGEIAGRAETFAEVGVQGIARHFDGAEYAYETHAFAALRALGNGAFYLYAATNHDMPDPRTAVLEHTLAADADTPDRLRKAHTAAWRDFWSRSAFTLSDPDLEMCWYASQYYLAVSAGNKRFPPGLYGNFITVEHPGWHGDYHLNYNYQAPFYAACSSNHPELTDGYMTPLEEFLEKGESYAKKFDCRGVLYPVAIAPKGLCTEWNETRRYAFDRIFMGQKNNQLHPADIAVMRWRATRDEAFAREHAYPYLKACLLFFEDYGTWEDGRYSVCQDSAHEVPIYRDDYRPEKYKRVLNDKNNVVTLGLLHMALDAAIDMARALGDDTAQIEKWEHWRAHLSPFPTCVRLGQRVYRYTESGQRWNETGDVGLQHVYPMGCVGLSSPPEELRLARTTFRQKQACFFDDNAVSSYFPMAARLGMRPRLILQKLRQLQAKFRLPNHLYDLAGGGLEYCPIAASTLNEMALQSHQDVVRLFPCWDASLDCTFRDLRADGAFLVSSSIRAGLVGETRVTAEKGGELRMILPFSHAQVRRGDTVFTVDDGSFCLQTQPGDLIIITNYLREKKTS